MDCHKSHYKMSGGFKDFGFFCLFFTCLLVCFGVLPFILVRKNTTLEKHQTTIKVVLNFIAEEETDFYARLPCVFSDYRCELATANSLT